MKLVNKRSAPRTIVEVVWQGLKGLFCGWLYIDTENKYASKLHLQDYSKTYLIVTYTILLSASPIKKTFSNLHRAEQASERKVQRQEYKRIDSLSGTGKPNDYYFFGRKDVTHGEKSSKSRWTASSFVA